MHCCRAGNVQELNHRMGGLGTSGNTETETEVRKRKYGNGNTEVKRKAAYWCLVHECALLGKG